MRWQSLPTTPYMHTCTNTPVEVKLKLKLKLLGPWRACGQPITNITEMGQHATYDLEGEGEGAAADGIALLGLTLRGLLQLQLQLVRAAVGALCARAWQSASWVQVDEDGV